MGHVRDAESGVAVHRGVNNIDGIATKYRVDKWARRSLPAVEFVLPHQVDELMLLVGS